jgi:hypothetical protein
MSSYPALDQSIITLKKMLRSNNLTAQEDKEIRAEIEMLYELWKKEYEKRMVRDGISMYGSYFDVAHLH